MKNRLATKNSRSAAPLHKVPTLCWAPKLKSTQRPKPTASEADNTNQDDTNQIVNPEMVIHIPASRTLFVSRFFAMIVFLFAVLVLWNRQAGAASEDFFSADEFDAIEIDQTKVDLSPNVLGSPETLWVEGRAQEAIWALERDHRYAEAEALTEKIQSTLESDKIEFFHSIATDREDSNPHLVTFASGLQAMIKSIDDSGLESIENEIAAFKLDRFLGLNRVPITVKRKIGSSFFGVQLWVPDSHPSHLEFRDKPKENYIRHPDIWLLDFLLGSWDRHGRNSLITADQYLVAIDNGRIGRENLLRDSLADSISVDKEMKNRLAHFNEYLLDYELEGLLSHDHRTQLIARIKRLNQLYAKVDLTPPSLSLRGYLSRERGAVENKKLSLTHYKKPQRHLLDRSGDEYDLEFEINPVRVLHQLLDTGDTSGLFTQVREAKTSASRLRILERLRELAETNHAYRRVYEIFTKDPNMAVLVASIDRKFCEKAMATPSLLGLILGQYRQPQYADLEAKPLLNLLSVYHLGVNHVGVNHVGVSGDQTQSANLITAFLASAKANPNPKVYFEVLRSWLKMIQVRKVSPPSKNASLKIETKTSLEHTPGTPAPDTPDNLNQDLLADALNKKVAEQISKLIKENDHVRLAFILVALNYVAHSSRQKILSSWITQILDNYQDLPKEIADTLFDRGQNFLTLFLEQASLAHNRGAIRSLFLHANKDHTGYRLDQLNQRRIVYQDILTEQQTNMCRQVVGD